MIKHGRKGDPRNRFSIPSKRRRIFSFSFVIVGKIIYLLIIILFQFKASNTNFHSTFSIYIYKEEEERERERIFVAVERGQRERGEWKRRYVFANVGAVLEPPTPYEIISSLLERRCAETLRPRVGKIAARLQELLEKLIIFPVS